LLPPSLRFVQQEFVLQDPIDALSQCILITVVTIGHRAGNVVALMDGFDILPNNIEYPCQNDESTALGRLLC